MKCITLFLLSSFLVACSQKHKKDIMPIDATIFHIDCSCYEDTLLDKKSPDTMRELFFGLV